MKNLKRLFTFFGMMVALNAVAGPCEMLHTATRLDPSQYATRLNTSDDADRAKCDLPAGDYNCVNVAIRHCDLWDTNNEAARACGRELIRNGCLNLQGLNDYQGAGIVVQ